jgi:nucleoside-diphosphate-sugar epimerase
MRVFVAGATGAIGKQLVPRLIVAGHEVHGMTRNESKQAMLRDLGTVPVIANGCLTSADPSPPTGTSHQARSRPATCTQIRHCSCPGRDDDEPHRTRNAGPGLY